MSELVIFEGDRQPVEVRLEDETQIADAESGKWLPGCRDHGSKKGYDVLRYITRSVMVFP